MGATPNSYDMFQLFAGLRRAAEVLRGCKWLLAERRDDVSGEVLNGALENAVQLEDRLDEFSGRFAITLGTHRDRYATANSFQGAIPS